MKLKLDENLPESAATRWQRSATTSTPFWRNSWAGEAMRTFGPPLKPRVASS